MLLQCNNKNCINNTARHWNTVLAAATFFLPGCRLTWQSRSLPDFRLLASFVDKLQWKSADALWKIITDQYHSMSLFASRFAFLLLNSSVLRKKENAFCISPLRPDWVLAKAIIWTITCFGSHLNYFSSWPQPVHSLKRQTTAYFTRQPLNASSWTSPYVYVGHYLLLRRWQSCPSRGPCISDNKHKQLCQRAADTLVRLIHLPLSPCMFHRGRTFAASRSPLQSQPED